MSISQLRKLGIDPGFSEFRIAEVCGPKENRNVRVEVLPALVGIGTKQTGLLDNSIIPKRRLTKPHEVQFNGRGVTYLVGPNVQFYTDPLERFDLERLAHSVELQVMLYSGLYRMLGEGSHRVGLLFGQPIQLINDDARGQELLNGLRSWLVGEHEFTIDGRNSHVIIEQVTATAQPAGSYADWAYNAEGKWQHPEEQHLLTSGSLVSVIDPGFNTLDIYSVIGRNPSYRHCLGNQEAGMRRVAEAIHKELDRLYGVKKSLYEIDQLMRSFGQGKVPVMLDHSGGARTNITELVKEALHAGYITITGSVERTLGSAKNVGKLILSGGTMTSPVLRKQLVGKYPLAFVPGNPGLSNITGLGKMAAFLIKGE